MFRYLADQNFNGKIVRGALLQNANLEIVRIQETEIDGAKDPEVLSWAAKENRIVLTHDRATMPHFSHLRVTAGEPMPGVLVVDDWLERVMHFR